MPKFLPSELPVRAVARHHWIVLLRLPNRYVALTFLVLALLALVWPFPFAWAFGVLALGAAIQRWRLWRADRIYLTGLRVIEVSGVPELTRSERFLRLDRVAGAEFVQSALGSLLDYATIELTAPGDRVDVRKFARIAEPDEFYRILRGLALGDNSHYHPDEDAGEYLTEPLPHQSQHDNEYHDNGSWD